MTDLFNLILGLLASLFKSRAKLEAEVLILRQQIFAGEPRSDRISTILIVFCLFGFVTAIAIVRPETIIRWHRAGFRTYWRWRSRNHLGRPKIAVGLRTLIGKMSRANPLWGAPHIHGELLKLGFEVAQLTVARYMCRHSRPHLKAGGRFWAAMPTASQQSTFLSCQRSRSGSSIVLSSCGMDEFGCRLE